MIICCLLIHQSLYDSDLTSSLRHDIFPLVDFKSTKCKRCGFYEERLIKSDDVFDEWEFCPDDFNSDDGRYIHTKDEELNATFVCKECVKKGIAYTHIMYMFIYI
ncbi:hypothetical protein HanOQP8_Chr11g0423981 [Helianthus annuus]|nr:hypothetical protein HanOQP8_Chr11g0423981 [Helianthus annuus]